MSTSQRRSLLSRERILAAATELFAARGFAGTGVDRVAESSGIAKTAIYYHFGNKEGLLAAVVERAAGAWIEGISEASRQAGEPAARLDRALLGMRAMLEEKPWILKLIQILALEVAAERPEIRASLQRLMDQARAAIVQGIRDALGLDVPDADGVASALLAMLNGIALGLEIDPEGLSLDDAFVDIRRAITFLIAIRLNPELGRFFDAPSPERAPELAALLSGALPAGEERP